MAVHDAGCFALDDACVRFDVWFAAGGFGGGDEAGWRVTEGLGVFVDAET